MNREPALEEKIYKILGSVHGGSLRVLKGEVRSKHYQNSEGIKWR